MSLPALDEASLDDLYKWIDTIPLSRPRKNISRDFSDGVLAAEVVHHFFPKLVELYQYQGANSSVEKRYNWTLLNNKVFNKIGFHVQNHVIHQVILGRPGAIEFILSQLRLKIDQAITKYKLPRPRNANICTFGSGSYSRPRNSGSVLSLDRLSLASNQDMISPAEGNATTAPTNSTGFACRSANASPRTRQSSSSSIEECSYTCGSKELVPSTLLYDAKQQILAKDEQLQVFQARITHMERLCQLKDERIHELTVRLDRLSQELFRQHNLNWNGLLNQSEENVQDSIGQ